MRQQEFIVNRECKDMALGLLSLSVLCLLGWTSGGSALGGCPSVRLVPMMGWTRTNFAQIWGWRMNIQPAPKLKSLVEGPYCRRCFTEVNTWSRCFAKVIASKCSLNKHHQ